MKKTVRDIDVSGKKVLVRCDFNVPMKDGEITDDIRITSALPTIRYLMENGARVILMSHMGRPKGEAKPEFSLKPVADRLSKLLEKDIIFAPSDAVVDDSVKAAAEAPSGRAGDAAGKRQIQEGRNKERGAVYRAAGIAGRNLRK